MYNIERGIKWFIHLIENGTNRYTPKIVRGTKSFIHEIERGHIVSYMSYRKLQGGSYPRWR